MQKLAIVFTKAKVLMYEKPVQSCCVQVFFFHRVSAAIGGKTKTELTSTDFEADYLSKS